MKNKRVLENDFNDLRVFSKHAKLTILTMTTLAKSGHPGGSMSSLDLLIAIYDYMNISYEDIRNPNRDRIVVSQGHISPAVYSVLAFNGFISIENVITQYRLALSPFEGHIERIIPGIEWATGNLGQGLSAATAFAMESKIKNINNRIFCIMGDGEQQKGQLGEARRFASKYELKNLTAIIDHNGLQINGSIENVMPQNIRDNYASDGWAVLETDGHDFIKIFKALEDAQKIDQPVLIIANTVMGKGVSFMENKAKFHGTPLTEEELFKAYDELGEHLAYNDFKEKRRHIAENAAEFFRLHKMKDKHADLTFSFTVDNNKVYTAPTDNRSAWGDAIADIARLNLNGKSQLAVFDCDLQPSVKTAEFEKIMPKNFIQAGIMEHHTAVCAGALSTTGIQTFFVDFGVFGIDETYNQHRLNDINHANLKVILTHVGLDVGEDGKTHQCIDYIGLPKNLFGYKVILPADPNQTYKAINYVVNQRGNYVIAMGRSKLDIIKNEAGEVFFGADYTFEYGKEDVLRQGDQATVFACGTLVNTAVKVVDELKQAGYNVMLVNISSPLAISDDIISQAIDTGHIFTIEDHSIYTGLGNIVALAMVKLQRVCPLHRFGVDKYACSGASEDVYAVFGLDKKSLVESITRELGVQN